MNGVFKNLMLPSQQSEIHKWKKSKETGDVLGDTRKRNRTRGRR